MLVLINIAYCRDEQLIWRAGRIKKAAFSG